MFLIKLPSGTEVSCSTAAEVLSLEEAILTKSLQSRAVPQLSDQEMCYAKGYEPPRKNIEFVHRFLRVLISSEERGVSGSDLAALLSVGGPRGLGGATSLVNRTLREIGMASDMVFRTRNVGDETRWFPGPMAFEAVHIIERSVASDGSR